MTNTKRKTVSWEQFKEIHDKFKNAVKRGPRPGSLSPDSDLKDLERYYPGVKFEIYDV